MCNSVIHVSLSVHAYTAQLCALVDQISSSVKMETVSSAADNATASETVPMDLTKLTAKTVSVCQEEPLKVTL